MSKTFREWNVEQGWLLPPSVMDFVPPDHMAHFIRDTVREQLDLSEILAPYEKEERGYPPYHPAMMTALLLYAYCQGVYSSRRIARGCEDRMDFMAVTGLNRPDFRTVSDFRKRHLEALQGLFVQVLQLCQHAGLVKLGHVSLDGTKMKANASKHKAMSYGRMRETELHLKRQVREWFKQAQSSDAAEDRQHGQRRGDELPDWVADKQRRIAKIREARKALEAEAIAAGEAAPQSKAQRNFTDPESRIMRKSGKEYVQAYNAQAAVDSQAQIIVAQSLSNCANDVQQLAPTLKQIKANTGRQAQEFSADAGYCSEGNLAVLARHHVDAYIATGRQRHHEASAAGRRRTTEGTRVAAMRTKLARGGRRSRYRLRKSVVEPVFGQIKQARGFRQFLLRGLEKVQGEWSLICTVHNLLKLAKALKGH